MNAKTFIYEGKSYTLDDHGYLNPSEQWDKDFAEGIAETLGIYGGLTKEHWDFINYLRKKFLEENTVPVVVVACADNKLRLTKFKRMFPTGYHRGACKIAGINYEFMYTTNYWLTYETSPILKAEYKMTQTGFLMDFNQWNERFVQLILKEWKFPGKLTTKQGRTIDFLRDYYIKTKSIPTVFETCKKNKLAFSELRDLFPGGYRRGACRIAGLPFFP